MKKVLVFLVTALFIHTGVLAQVITLNSENPSFSDEITLSFYADKGNAGLKDHEGDVYVHTGLITNESNNLGEWKKVVADWGDNEKSPKMKRTESNTYTLQFKIADLYGIPATGGNVVALAFVFRNEDGSITGKAQGGKDIYYFFREPDFKAPPKVYENSKAFKPDWADHASIYEVNIRQYTEEGTINAFSEHLPRLRELGVDILWFMPIQPIGEVKRKGKLGSYYSIRDYTAVNPEFGTLDDFKQLVKKAHGMGFKVILDWVANHSAWDNEWVYSNPDWYTRDKNGNMVSPYDWTDVADLNYDMYYMRKAMMDAMLFWVQEVDIDGFRCDVAGEVPLDFWEDIRHALDKSKSVWMLAEDGSQLALLNRAFNANYGWHFHHLMNQSAKGEIPAAELLKHFEEIKNNYPKGSYPMQFITNHDENSWAGTIYERLGEGHKAFAVLSFTVPGIPLIYSGQEAGLNKRLEFFEKDPIDWSDQSLAPFYTRLNDLKAQNPALWNGCAGGWIEVLENNHPDDVVSFVREKEGNTVLTLINLSKKDHIVQCYAGDHDGVYQDFFTGDHLVIDQRSQLELQAWEYKVLVYKHEDTDHKRKYQGMMPQDSGIKILTNDGDIVVTPYSEHAFEVEFIPIGEKNPPSYGIAIEEPELQTQVKEFADSIVYSTTNMDVVIVKDPFQLKYNYLGKKLTAEESGYFDSCDHSGFRFELDPDEKLTGGGSRVLGMNRRGHRLNLYNKPSYGYETEAPWMYYSMPVVVSSDKYMLTFDNGARGYADLGATEQNILEFGATGGRMSYVLVAGKSWPELITHFTDVTGRQPMLPRWTLGNIASRMGYHSQAEAEQVVKKYLEEDIPLDAIVFDLFWFGPDIKGHVGNLEWYRDSFPQPEQMMQNFLKKGVKTVLITEPFVLENTLKYDEVIKNELVGKTSDGKPYHFDFYFGHTTLLDIFKPETRDWFWNIYKRHTLSGVAGWWGDLGEPEVHPDDMVHVNGPGEHVHNLYGHEWAGTIFRGYQKDFPNERPVILMRSGFVGSQRYGIIPWTGDVNRTWGGLKPQVELSLTMGLQGIGLMHSDLGGFAGNYKDAELYTRWLQYGVFQPVYRTHAQEDVPPEPIFWDKTTKDIARKYIKLRYQLTPYNYSLLFNYSQTGVPMMRPLFYVEDTPEMFDVKDSYLWGDAFLVAPVVEKGIKKQKVYLPKGNYWFDFWTDDVYKGGKTINYKLSIETIPVFVLAGSFIPMVDAIQNMDKYTTTDLELHFYHHSESKESDYLFYDDDGKTNGAFEKELFEQIACRSLLNENNRIITLNPRLKNPRNITLVVHGYKDFSGRILNGQNELKYTVKDQLVRFHFPLNDEQVTIQIIQ